MPVALPSLPPDQLAAGQVALAALLGTAGFYFLLPRPRGRSVAVGVALSVASLVVGTLYLGLTFGLPATDYVGPALFWLFAGAALVFGGLLVAQANPARGALAFAFVILSTCGLFLLLAAPFLMAATVIIYMGAVVVTFLFVLMLSHAQGPSDENDRSREPLLGSLAGFAFAGLILFTLYVGSPASLPAKASQPRYPLPVTGVTPADGALLAEAAADLRAAVDAPDAAGALDRARRARVRLAAVVGYAPGETVGEDTDAGLLAGRVFVQDRLRVGAADARVARLVAQADELRDAKSKALDAVENAALERDPDLAPARAALAAVRDKALVLAGRGELPARNVSALGLILYSEHLLAVELAGTLLLVATVGAVAMTGRKGVAA